MCGPTFLSIFDAFSTKSSSSRALFVAIAFSSDSKIVVSNVVVASATNEYLLT